MGKSISEEKIIEINEVYLQCKVKSQTAKIVGVSPATVTKYLIPNYSSQKDNNEKVEFNEEIAGAQNFINGIREIVSSKNYTPIKAFCKICELSSEEQKEIKEIQKGIMI